MEKHKKNRISHGICTFKDGKLVDTMPISKYEYKYVIIEVYKLKLPAERHRRKEEEDWKKYCDRHYK